MSSILTLPKLHKAIIKHRPSKLIRSPYVADIYFPSEPDKLLLGHTPALGCSGLVEVGSVVYVYDTHEEAKCQGKKATTKCRYRIVQAEIEDKREYPIEFKKHKTKLRVGTAPKLAEQLVSNLLTKNKLEFLDVEEFKAEVTRGDSRFDFAGKEKDGTKFILEVKNVPLADFEDINSREKKKNMKNRKYEDVMEWIWEHKVAYFPDGYRKCSNDPMSERALKHVNGLREIMEDRRRKNSEKLSKSKSRTPLNIVETRCIMIYVVQRTDVLFFQPSVLDKHFQKAFKKAYEAGVEMYPIMVEWRGNKAYYKKILDFNLPE